MVNISTLRTTVLTNPTLVKREKSPFTAVVITEKALAIFRTYVFFILSIDKRRKRVYHIRDLRITLILHIKRARGNMTYKTEKREQAALHNMPH